MNIDHSQKVLADLGDIVSNGIEIFKNGIGLGSLKKVFALEKEFKDLIAEAKQAMPELKDLDPSEVQLLLASSYALVKKIISEISV